MVPLTAASGVFGSRYYLVQLNLRPLDASMEMMGLWSFGNPPAWAQAAANEYSVRFGSVVPLEVCQV
jgi:hypothetical protein